MHKSFSFRRLTSYYWLTLYYFHLAYLYLLEQIHKDLPRHPLLAHTETNTRKRALQSGPFAQRAQTLSNKKNKWPKVNPFCIVVQTCHKFPSTNSLDPAKNANKNRHTKTKVSHVHLSRPAQTRMQTHTQDLRSGERITTHHKVASRFQHFPRQHKQMELLWLSLDRARGDREQQKHTP